jgi:hypothetical protein
MVKFRRSQSFEVLAGQVERIVSCSYSGCPARAMPLLSFGQELALKDASFQFEGGWLAE